jgi:hypothetical protein
VGIENQDVKSIDNIFRVLAEWTPGRALMIQRIREKNKANVKVVPTEAR